MANTLTNLIPDVYAALDVVSRELTGFIPSVYRDAKSDMVAAGQTLRVPLAPAVSGSDISAAMSVPAAADQAFTNATLTISKSRAFPFSWSGEEQMGVESGAGYLTMKQQNIAQAIRAAANEIEADIAAAAYKGSRASGTAATTPFASTLADTAQLRKILDDNGAPVSDRALVIDTTAGAALRTLAQLSKANEAGDSSLLRQGVLLDVHGFAIRESAQVVTPSVGTGSGYKINNASGYAKGATALTVDTGSGTIVAGDIIAIGAHKYVVASALASNVVTIAAPGLQAAVADNADVTLIAAGPRNVGFSRNGILLGTRLPAVPAEGDMAVDREVITDPRTGLSFELSIYPGYRMVRYQIGISWGVSVIKPEHVAVLLG